MKGFFLVHLAAAVGAEASEHFGRRCFAAWPELAELVRRKSHVWLAQAKTAEAGRGWLAWNGLKCRFRVKYL